jgi:hypothetical protein
MNKPVTFRYNGKQYTTNDLTKKLNKMGITENEIELANNKVETQSRDFPIYLFKNKKKGDYIESIYSTLDSISNYINVDDYEFIGTK